MDEEQRSEFDAWLDPSTIPIPERFQEHVQDVPGEPSFDQRKQDAAHAAMAAAFAMEPASTMVQR